MDASEFKRRFLPYHRRIYGVAFRLTGNLEDAEDMVQEAYLRLLD
ncbi:MAG: RNA polymerase subunit sigma-70, partial [Muribaculaceae bacterium]|nr:RNA polymerase subunit sigma-70 [Muribaculaceae bacterium]